MLPSSKLKVPVQRKGVTSTVPVPKIPKPGQNSSKLVLSQAKPNATSTHNRNSQAQKANGTPTPTPSTSGISTSSTIKPTHSLAPLVVNSKNISAPINKQQVLERSAVISGLGKANGKTAIPRKLPVRPSVKYDAAGNKKHDAHKINVPTSTIRVETEETRLNTGLQGVETNSILILTNINETEKDAGVLEVETFSPINPTSVDATVKSISGDAIGPTTKVRNFSPAFLNLKPKETVADAGDADEYECHFEYPGRKVSTAPEKRSVDYMFRVVLGTEILNRTEQLFVQQYREGFFGECLKSINPIQRIKYNIFEESEDLVKSPILSVIQTRNVLGSFLVSYENLNFVLKSETPGFDFKTIAIAMNCADCPVQDCVLHNAEVFICNGIIKLGSCEYLSCDSSSNSLLLKNIITDEAFIIRWNKAPESTLTSLKVCQSQKFGLNDSQIPTDPLDEEKDGSVVAIISYKKSLLEETLGLKFTANLNSLSKALILNAALLVNYDVFHPAKFPLR